MILDILARLTGNIGGSLIGAAIAQLFFRDKDSAKFCLKISIPFIIISGISYYFS